MLRLSLLSSSSFPWLLVFSGELEELRNPFRFPTKGIYNLVVVIYNNIICYFQFLTYGNNGRYVAILLTLTSRGLSGSSMKTEPSLSSDSRSSDTSLRGSIPYNEFIAKFFTNK